MSQRLVLLGAKQGPWCGIKKIKDPVLEISGLSQGSVRVELPTKDGGVFLSADGRYSLRELFGDCPTEFIRCHASHPTSKLICTVKAA